MPGLDDSVSEFIGWVPNISGQVTSCDHLESPLGVRDSSTVDDLRTFQRVSDDVPVEFTYRLGSRSVECIHPDCKVIIHLDDDKGMCRITVSECNPNLSTKLLKKSAASACWRLFKAEIDGCTDTICECRPMDEIYDHDLDPYRTIIQGFILGLESITDSRNNITQSSWAVLRVGREAEEEAALKSILVYSGSFVRLYRSELGEDAIWEFEEVRDLRIGKFNIATTNHRFRYTLSTTVIMLAISLSALIIAIVSLIYSL